jgi:hypothetical protein
VADYAGNLVVHKALRYLGGGFRVSLVIFGNHFKLDRLAVQFQVFSSGFFGSQLDAIVGITAPVCKRAGQRIGEPIFTTTASVAPAAADAFCCGRQRLACYRQSVPIRRR